MSVAQFIADEIADCRTRGIFVNLAPTPTLKSGGIETTGWFDETSLQVAIDRPLRDWLGTLVHESCHKDQFVENAPVWADVKLNGVHDCCGILDLWLDGLVEVAPERMAEVVAKVQSLELDCERRSVEKIKSAKLPLDLDAYIRSANVYVWFHLTLPITRRWVVAPYNNPRLLEMMPPHFDNDYSKLPDGFLEIVRESLA